MFDSRSRQLTESVSAYVAELRRLAHDCNFGTTLEQRLRDRLVLLRIKFKLGVERKNDTRLSIGPSYL